MDLLAQPALRPDPHHVADDEHADDEFRIDRWPPGVTVKAAKICVQFTEIPAIALVPVAIVWFGIGEGSKYFVVSYTVFLTVWFNTHHGMQYVPETYLRASRTLGASRLREFLTVVLPAAAPHIFAGIRLGVALAFLSLVAAELSGASSGIGFRLQEARQYVRTDRMFSLLILLGILGAFADLIVHWIGRKLVHWEQG